MNLIALLLAIIAMTVSMADPQEQPQPSPVLVQLTESTIDDLVFSDSNKHDWLVMFGGWCKKLEPEFIQAANEHSLEKFNIKFAKADCTSEKSFNTRFDIEGYPTVKLIRDNIVFNAGSFRNATQIDEYIHRVVTLPVLRYTSEPMPKEFRSDPLFILVGNHKVMDSSSPLLERFSKAAWRMLPQFIRSYRLYEDISVPYIKRVSLGAPDIVYTISDEDSVTVEDLLKFMQDNKRPLVPEVMVENFKELVKSQLPWVISAINPERDQSSPAVFRKAVARGSEKLLFVWINSAQYPEWLQKFGIDPNVPSVFMYDPNMERYWVPTKPLSDSDDEIWSFIADVEQGKIQVQGPGRYHPAYLLRAFYQWVTSSFYEYSFSYEFAATTFCAVSTLVVMIGFCVRFAMRPKKAQKDKVQ